MNVSTDVKFKGAKMRLGGVAIAERPNSANKSVVNIGDLYFFLRSAKHDPPYRDRSSIMNIRSIAVSSLAIGAVFLRASWLRRRPGISARLSRDP